MPGSTHPSILLVDNGSLKARATLKLRELAAEVAEACGCQVDAVSLRFANKINSSELRGEPALILVDYLRQQLQAGQRNIVLIPLFFGQSRAITSFIPQQRAIVESEFGDMNMSIGEVLYPLPEGEPLLTRIIYENIQTVSRELKLKEEHVILVDHGSPSPQITEVRKHLANELMRLGGSSWNLSQAVMERRSGEEYDFNGPLLQEKLHELAQQGVKSVIVAMMFLLPGKHAGAGGDIAGICSDVKKLYPDLKIGISPLVSDNPRLISLLAGRIQDLLK